MNVFWVGKDLNSMLIGSAVASVRSERIAVSFIDINRCFREEGSVGFYIVFAVHGRLAKAPPWYHRWLGKKPPA